MKNRGTKVMQRVIHRISVLAFLFISSGFLASSFAASSGPSRDGLDPANEAFREGMVNGTWSSAIKDFFGTAYEAYDGNGGYSDQSPTAPISRVWFTGNRGALTEIYWPSNDTPQTVD